MTDVFKQPDPAAPPSADPVADLVGEGKKFKDVAALAKGKQEADAFIAKLEGELADLRKQVNPQFDAEKQLEDLRKELQALRADPPAGRSREVTPPALTEDRIAALVSETITRAEQNRTAEQNINKANDAVIAKFGTLDAAAKAVEAKAAELKVTTAYLKDIAAKSPTAFEQIMFAGIQEPSKTPLDPKSANPSATVIPGNNLQPGTKAFFDNILKTDKKRYWSPEVQMALHKAAKDGTYQ